MISQKVLLPILGAVGVGAVGFYVYKKRKGAAKTEENLQYKEVLPEELLPQGMQELKFRYFV